MDMKKRFSKAFKGYDEKDKSTLIKAAMDIYKSLRADKDSGCSAREDFDTTVQDVLENSESILKEGW